MSTIFRATPRLLHLVALSLLMAPIPAEAAEARKGPDAKPVLPAATTDIVELPLNPTLPTGQRVCTAKTASGLGYLVLRPATGDKPAKADFVLVNYIGYLAATGVVFDQGMRTAFAVSDVIPGFTEGLQTLAKGGIARFCIPAAMGYGPDGSGPIPANSDLVFQVELIDYKTAAEVEAMRKEGAAEPTVEGQ